jgi:VWFA-related protein
LAAADDTPVFRSDVSMGRIDTLVLDRTQHPIGGLRKEDFILRKDGTPIPIRNLAFEDLPVDVLLLLDVSGSMNVHVQKVASAAHEALGVLGAQDRVGIMVFTTRTRLRLPFHQDLKEVERRLDSIVDSESFNGGTNINGALLDAAAYVEKQGRRQVRHAIVIVTDDQALPCDQTRILAELDRADAVLMVLLAPVFMGPYPGGGSQGGQPPVMGPWPGGGGLGGPLGGVILGRRRGPSSIPGSPPVVLGNPRGMSAGSPSIARASGGDSLNVNDASSVEDTFERIRQRYALYFYLPDGVKDGRGIEVDLTNTARRRHPDAALQYRQVALTENGSSPGLITRVPPHSPSIRDPEPDNAESSDVSPEPAQRRVAVNDSSGSPVSLPVQPVAGTNAPADQRHPAVTVRRRGVSEPSGTPGATIGPPQ